MYYLHSCLNMDIDLDKKRVPQCHKVTKQKPSALKTCGMLHFMHVSMPVEFSEALCKINLVYRSLQN